MSEENKMAQERISKRGVCICDLCGRNKSEFEDEMIGKGGKVFCLAYQTEMPRSVSVCELFCPERSDIDRRISREATACAERIALYAKLLQA